MPHGKGIQPVENAETKLVMNRSFVQVRRILTSAVVTLAACNAAAQPAFPTRPVTIVVPYAAGGGTDAIARRLAQGLATRWKQTVVVENIPGADGVIGTQRALRAPADGHTLLMQLNQMLLWGATAPTAKIDIQKDVRLISKIQHSPLVVVASPKFPGATLKEFAAWCQSANPSCTWGSATHSGQLAGKQLLDAAAVKNAIHAPYKGTTPMITDVMGGHITMGLVTVAAGLPHLKSGALKFLAIGSRERFPAAKDTPTMVEQGYPVEAGTWFGIMVARDTPSPIVDAIAAGIRAVSQDPELLKAIETNGGAPIFNSPQQFQREVEEEARALAPVLATLKAAGP